MWFGLAYASATTAAAPALMKPAAKLSTRWRAMVQRALGDARLAVARRVAEVVEQHDRVLREVDVRGDRPLAEVLVRGVVAAGARVQPEAVLGRRVEAVAVLARPAVAVAHVDDEAGALERVPDRRPGGVGRVDLGDVRGVLACERRGCARLRAIAGRRRSRRPDDHDHLGHCPALRRGSRCHGRDEAREKQRREDGDEGASHDRRHSCDVMVRSLTHRMHPHHTYKALSRPLSVHDLRKWCRGAPSGGTLVRRTIGPCPIASPARPARTSSSTRTTRSTGSPGVVTRSRGRSYWTARSSSRSATRPVTGATSWSASRSRTRRPPGC